MHGIRAPPPWEIDDISQVDYTWEANDASGGRGERRFVVLPLSRPEFAEANSKGEGRRLRQQPEG